MFIQKWLDRLVGPGPQDPPLVEGLYADQYPELDTGGVRRTIRERYHARWPDPNSDPTPLTQPWRFDPCQPPQGWRYDPYYECWIAIND